MNGERKKWRNSWQKRRESEKKEQFITLSRSFMSVNLRDTPDGIVLRRCRARRILRATLDQARSSGEALSKVRKKWTKGNARINAPRWQLARTKDRGHIPDYVARGKVEEKVIFCRTILWVIWQGLYRIEPSSAVSRSEVFYESSYISLQF